MVGNTPPNKIMLIGLKLFYKNKQEKQTDKLEKFDRNRLNIRSCQIMFSQFNSNPPLALPRFLRPEVLSFVLCRHCPIECEDSVTEIWIGETCLNSGKGQACLGKKYPLITLSAMG